MLVQACKVPEDSGLHHLCTDGVFQDSYRTRLADPRQGIAPLYAALFGYHPVWVKLILVARNVTMRGFGLEVPSLDEIMRPQMSGPFEVGKKVGPWPIFHVSDQEIIAGRDNPHMNFRVSVLKTHEFGSSVVTVSTVCLVHNRFGQRYLRLVAPFHRAGVKALMARAVAAGRI